ncbi:MAG: excinuclease ABC subunit UvrA [Flavobacteriaceae bacterium]|nr:excinuclease ABC subunit UvrA [Flavobacteriaceae bacterium]
MKDLSKVDPKHNIIIKGAKLHNLKNVDVVIPRNKFTVITGLSGSGKSSLAYDTLYAEGQRRYVESLSSYARQFMGKLNKPKVDYIKGISPAIAVEQKINTSNPRSTVGTKTEIYDYLKLLFARIGKTYSPKSNEIVKKDSTSDVVDHIIKLKVKSKLLLLAPIESSSKKISLNKLDILKKQGFVRIYKDNEVMNISDVQNEGITDFKLVVDRLVVSNNPEFISRVADSVQLSFYEGNGICSVFDIETNKEVSFSNKYEMDGVKFIEPSVHLFSFNNPFGACKNCDGFGETIGIDEELVIPNKSLSVYDDAIAPWRGTGLRKYYMKLIDNADLFDFPIYKPYSQLSKEDVRVLWDGNEHFGGINKFFKYLEKKNYKIQNRVLLSRYRGKTLCNDCRGSRLRKESYYVKIDDKHLPEILSMPIDKLSIFFKEINLSQTDKDISSRILKEINNRIDYLMNVGLSYLTLNRKANTLSGGETQRINLASSLGSSLVGSTYILDEPSIGLHSRDNDNLIKILKNLKEIGNTVIVVEHDEEIILSADHIVDIGPMAGTLGGEIVGEGNVKQLLKTDTLTSKYLNKIERIEYPSSRRESNYFINVNGAQENNLQNITVKIPLGCLTMITGVSGSGKSTLVKKIIYPALLNYFRDYSQKPGKFNDISGNLSKIKSVQFIDQNPIGRSSRSNPVTYLKVYDDIRNLYAKIPQSVSKGFKSKFFSFNTDGGRCDECKGEGVVKIEMQFMADVELECDICKGKRFKDEITAIKYNGVSIDMLLNMTVDDSIQFFRKYNQSKIVSKLLPLQSVGLGYVSLGQSSNTLSGGEAQRIKLASFIGKGDQIEKTFFIFDEPTTGLHFHDVRKLLNTFDKLIRMGHSILVIEHNMDMISCADHIIDLGPEGGDKGGEIIAEGTPEEIIKIKKSYTGHYLKNKII